MLASVSCCRLHFVVVDVVVDVVVGGVVGVVVVAAGTIAA